MAFNAGKERSGWQQKAVSGAASPECRAEMLAWTLQADLLHDDVQASKCSLLRELIS